MKEASGELNMTLVTIIAVAAIGTIFALLWPNIKNTIGNKFGTSINGVDNDMGNAKNKVQDDT